MNALPSLSSVTLIVVTYNSAHCLPALHSLLGQCPHVVVSDNASTDGAAAQARQLWPHATVLAHSNNLGFGAANNQALAQVHTPVCPVAQPRLRTLGQPAPAVAAGGRTVPPSRRGGSPVDQRPRAARGQLPLAQHLLGQQRPSRCRPSLRGLCLWCRHAAAHAVVPAHRLF